MNRSYYAIIPANVRYDKNLCANAKLMYGEITALTNEKGYCWATNQYFADLYDVSIKSISVWINQLVSAGYISSTLVYFEGKKQVKERILKIAPMEEKLPTYTPKVLYPMEENFYTPMEEKVKENNTFINDLSSSNKGNPKISESQEFLLKNYSLDSLKFSLQQQTPAKYEILKKQHKVKLDELLSNFLAYHENKPYPNFESIVKHLLSYNFIKSEVSKEKNFAPKKESFYAPATPAKVYKKPELTEEEREEYRKQLELKNKHND